VADSSPLCPQDGAGVGGPETRGEDLLRTAVQKVFRHRAEFCQAGAPAAPELQEKKNDLVDTLIVKF
jgi:hypothetical protein